MKRSAPPDPRSILSSSLPSTTHILRGSLLKRHIRHRSGCSVCANGLGHLVWVLAVSYPGRRIKHISLHPDQVPLVQQCLSNFHQIKDILEQICELNQQLIVAERKSL